VGLVDQQHIPICLLFGKLCVCVARYFLINMSVLTSGSDDVASPTDIYTDIYACDTIDSEP